MGHRTVLFFAFLLCGAYRVDREEWFRLMAHSLTLSSWCKWKDAIMYENNAAYESHIEEQITAGLGPIS